MTTPTRSRFKRRPSTPPSETENVQSVPKRRYTVYDAVAGKVFQKDVLANPNPNSRAAPLRPDEVLYKARNAPTRYEETDHYFAHRNLPQGQSLPSGDLLSTLHAYVSHFYDRSEEPNKEKTWRCMDETALIALGILMEESAKEILGETGDLAFTEGVREEELAGIEGKDVNEEESEDEADDADSTESVDKGKRRAVDEGYDEDESVGSDSVYSGRQSDDGASE